MTNPLFPIPSALPASAADAKQQFDAQKFHETIAYCNQALAALEKQVPARYLKIPASDATDSVAYQYYTLTLILVNALAMLDEWKPAKEALGKYRVHFPRDPWGFRAGAEVQRRDLHVKDHAAVTRAAELLDGEATRLESLAK